MNRRSFLQTLGIGGVGCTVAKVKKKMCIAGVEYLHHPFPGEVRVKNGYAEVFSGKSWLRPYTTTTGFSATFNRSTGGMIYYNAKT